MGKVASRLTRPLRNWNIENRAHKVISKEKPTAAPMYDSTIKQIELVNKLEPNYKKLAGTKHAELDGFLKKVYVTSNSTEVQEIDSRENPDRPLPKDRWLHEGFELGFHVPEETKVGKINLKQALELINNYNTDPQKYNVESLAETYKMEPKLVADIIEYYRIFYVIEKEINHNTEAIARVMPISQRSGITIKHTVKKKVGTKKSKDDDEDDESSTKKISERRKVDQLEGK